MKSRFEVRKYFRKAIMSSEAVNLVICVCLASAGAIAQGTGYVVQKKGHIEVGEINEKAKSDEEKTSYTKNCKWATGFAVFLTGSILIAVALKFGAQSVVSPLGALTLVANTLLAHKLLGIDVSPISIICTKSII